MSLAISGRGFRPDRISRTASVRKAGGYGGLVLGIGHLLGDHLAPNAQVSTKPGQLQIGRAKTSLLKTLLYRSTIFGTRGFVLDPKGEYRALAAALGLEVVYLRPGGDVRLNP